MSNKIIRLGLITFVIMSIFAIFLSNNCYASLTCNSVAENNVRYVNATLTDINEEYYNAQMRQMSLQDYNNESDTNKAAKDAKSMLFGSVYGKMIDGIQNGYVKTKVKSTCYGVLQGLVKPKLENGNLKVVDSLNNGTSFFPTSGQTGSNKPYNEILANWKFPFLKEENGYYSFDSDKYHVTRDNASKSFKLHEGARSGFYPFNSCQDNTESEGNRNLYFTVRLDIPFLMTTDGKVKNSKTGQYDDMIFNFSGDDDVWVFVDDTLVLDLGGVHDRQIGNINFAKNQVYYARIYNQQTNSDVVDVYKTAFANGKLSSGKHTLKIFYMERAGGGSNLIVKFNLQSSGVQIKYMEKYTNKELDSVIKTGPVGETVELEEKTFKDKVLVEKPNVSSATLNEELQTFYYWYKSKYNLNTDYLDVFDGSKVAQSNSIKVCEDEKYTTENKNIPGYTLVEIPSNSTGIMPHNDVNVKYYYKYTDAKAKINYIDKMTGEVLDTVNKIGTEGDIIPLEEKSFDNYVLVEKPTEQYKYSKKEQIINYYYKQRGNVIVNYLDKTTKEELGKEVLEGLEGDVVNSEKREFNNYLFYSGPENNKHTITRDKQEVNYYYIKQSKITVHYTDKDSKEDLDKEESIVTEGTTYKTEEKEFNDYKLVESPNEKDIYVGRGDVEVYYYYQKLKFNLKVEMNLKQGTINDRFYELKNKTGKIETEIKEANSKSTSKIYYIIKVTNDQEKIGSGMLVDYIPEGYMATQEENPLWSISADRIYMDVDNINPGESREFEVVLTKKDGVDVCQVVSNLVKIEAKNNMKETSLNDNQDKNDVVIMPRTGADKIAVGVICALIALFVATIKIKRIFNKKSK